MKRDRIPTSEDHTYHIASIGKTLNSVLIGRLFEEGRIDFKDPIADYLSEEMLDNLHVFEGKDYAREIQVRNLLNHTSGIADYFEEKPKEGKAVLELALEDPDRFWTPEQTITWTKDHLRAHFPPGKGFFYSDTNYQLLGLILQNVTGKALHEIQHEYLFQPLHMKNSSLLFYSTPEEGSRYPLAEVYMDDLEVSTFRSMSIDWGGGGIVSTSEDLLRFIKSLVEGTLIQEETFDRMKDWARFARGIDYGYGLAHIKARELTFLLPERLSMWGNFGSTGTFMFYNPALDVYLIGAFNQSRYVRKQVVFMLRLMSLISKIKG